MKKIMKPLLIMVGTLSLVLGVIGIILPVLPTTPFLLLTAYCYLKSSTKLYQKLIQNKYLGEYIKNYYEKKGIPLKTKVYALITLWGSIIFCVFVVLDRMVLQIIVLAVASIVSIHILRQNTIKMNPSRK